MAWDGFGWEWTASYRGDGEAYISQRHAQQYRCSGAGASNPVEHTSQTKEASGMAADKSTALHGGLERRMGFLLPFFILRLDI
jgi:hypothetical protein